MSKRIKITGGGLKKKDKAPATSQSPTLEEDQFQAFSEYQNHLQMILKKVEAIKCLNEKLLPFTYFPTLLEKYRLAELLCFKTIVYPGLVRIFSANLTTINDKLSYYVMHKHMVIDSKVIVTKFEMDYGPPKLIIGSFPIYYNELAIRLLFPHLNVKDVSRKLMITGLSLENQILHFIIYKVLFPRAINFYTNCG